MIDATQTDPLGKRSLYRRSAVRVSAGTQTLHYINGPRSARGYAGDTGDQSVLTTLYLVNSYRRPPAHARQRESLRPARTRSLANTPRTPGAM